MQNMLFLQDTNSAVKEETLRSQDTPIGKSGGDVLRRQVILDTDQ